MIGRLINFFRNKIENIKIKNIFKKKDSHSNFLLSDRDVSSHQEMTPKEGYAPSTLDFQKTPIWIIFIVLVLLVGVFIYYKKQQENNRRVLENLKGGNPTDEDVLYFERNLLPSYASDEIPEVVVNRVFECLEQEKLDENPLLKVLRRKPSLSPAMIFYAISHGQAQLLDYIDETLEQNSQYTIENDNEGIRKCNPENIFDVIKSRPKMRELLDRSYPHLPQSLLLWALSNSCERVIKEYKDYELSLDHELIDFGVDSENVLSSLKGEKWSEFEKPETKEFFLGWALLHRRHGEFGGLAEIIRSDLDTSTDYSSISETSNAIKIIAKKIMMKMYQSDTPNHLSFFSMCNITSDSKAFNALSALVFDAIYTEGNTLVFDDVSFLFETWFSKDERDLNTDHFATMLNSIEFKSFKDGVNSMYSELEQTPIQRVLELYKKHNDKESDFSKNIVGLIHERIGFKRLGLTVEQVINGNIPSEKIIESLEDNEALFEIMDKSVFNELEALHHNHLTVVLKDAPEQQRIAFFRHYWANFNHTREGFRSLLNIYDRTICINNLAYKTMYDSLNPSIRKSNVAKSFFYNLLKNDFALEKVYIKDYIPFSRVFEVEVGEESDAQGYKLFACFCIYYTRLDTQSKDLIDIRLQSNGFRNSLSQNAQDLLRDVIAGEENVLNYTGLFSNDTRSQQGSTFSGLTSIR